VSGFVIPFSFASYGRVGFLVARIMRLYPTYMVGFCITLASLGVAAAGWHQAFPYALTAVLSHILPGMRDLIGSPNIDYVVWTLEVEVKFYIVCLLIAPLLRSGSALVFLAPAAIAALASIGLSHPPSHTALLAALFSGPMLIFMFIGVAVHYRFQRFLGNGAAIGIIAALFAAFCVLAKPAIYGPDFAIILPINYGAAALVFIACAALPASLFSGRLLNLAAEISYPLYVVHGVNGYILMRALTGIGVPPSLSILLAAATAISVAYLLHVVVELPTHRLGRRWGRMLTAWRANPSGLLDIERNERAKTA
jgi:peptidoglycan/LPS O-acetylase OafA/YrhL